MLLLGRWDEEPVNGQSEGEGQLLPQVDLAQIEEVFSTHCYPHFLCWTFLPLNFAKQQIHDLPTASELKRQVSPSTVFVDTGSGVKTTDKITARHVAPREKPASSMSPFLTSLNAGRQFLQGTAPEHGTL